MLNGLSQTGGILDDLIATGEDDAQHVSNLHKTLKKLERCGVKLKKSKCAIMQPHIEYFAFIVHRHEIHPSPAMVKAILEVQKPQNKTEIQSFLGLVNYYPKLISNMSSLAIPLNTLPPKNSPWCWSEECAKSFQDLKDTRTSSRVLAHHSPNLEVQLPVDASPFGLEKSFPILSKKGRSVQSLTPRDH